MPKLEAAGYAVWGFDPREERTMLLGTLEASVPASRGARMRGRFERCSPLAIEPEEFDLIVHLAANIKDISKRLEMDLQAFSDIALDYAVAEYVLEHPPREAFIAPSSCAIDTPEDPYSWVKLTGERFWMALYRAGVPTVILRPYSGYGEDQSESYPFPAILGRAMRKEDPLVVWGDGQQVRDFIHIEDLTDAFIWAIERAPRGIPIDIGTGSGTPFVALARMIAQQVGYEPKLECDTSKPASSPRRVANPQVAMECGFQTRISLEEGVRRAVVVRRERSPGHLRGGDCRQADMVAAKE